MTQVERLIAHIRRTLGDLNIPLLDAEHQYAALPLCVIDAVFSLGVRYESTERTVRDWCSRYHWELERRRAVEERTIDDFLKILQPYENRWDDMAGIVFRNLQRTSTRSGIRKAEAVYLFADTLQKFGIQTFADALKSGLRDELRRAIAAITGQGSGLSYKYFLILAGNKDAVKADRMVTRFVADALGLRNVSAELCEHLVREASAILRSEFPKLTPNLLDHAIWSYQRGQDQAASKNCRARISAR